MTLNGAPPTKEVGVPPTETPNECSPKKKKRNHKEASKRGEGLKEVPRAKEHPSDKGNEDENVPKTFNPRREEDYCKMLQHFRQHFVEADCDTTVIAPKEQGEE